MIEKRHLRHAEQTRRFPPRWLLGFADFSGTVTPHPQEEPRHFCSDEERHGGYITFACLPLRQPVLSLPLPSTPHTAAYLCIYLCTTSRRIYPFPSYTFSPPIFAPFSRSLPNFVPRTFVSPSSSPRNDSLSLSRSSSSSSVVLQRTAVFKWPRMMNIPVSLGPQVIAAILIFARGRVPCTTKVQRAYTLGGRLLSSLARSYTSFYRTMQPLGITTWLSYLREFRMRINCAGTDPFAEPAESTLYPRPSGGIVEVWRIENCNLVIMYPPFLTQWILVGG